MSSTGEEMTKIGLALLDVFQCEALPRIRQTIMIEMSC
jgi:hypothetical protein